MLLISGQRTNIMGQKVTVVYDWKTRKIYPHRFEPDGSVTILSSGTFDDERLIVGIVDSMRLDLFNGYVLERRDGKKRT
jgi:hypothetical protein